MSDNPPLIRRHDVDAIRVGALILLIVYHIALCFQSWGSAIHFPQNEDLIQEIWPLMGLINVWRIPLLFLVSGMGMRFALERRGWLDLLKDRTVRLAVPYLFGIVVLNLLFAVLLPRWGWNADFTIHFGHLWFLLNIYLYVLWTLGVMIYLKDNPRNSLFRFVRRLIVRPWGLLLFGVPMVIEAQLVNPTYYSTYVDSLHGWLVGLVCFMMGLLFASLQDVFWPTVMRVRWFAVGSAAAMFLVRWQVFEFEDRINGMTGLESYCWMLAILGFGAAHLNRSSKWLRMASESVFPVYIVHMPVQFALAYLILPRPWPAGAKLGMLLIGTLGASLLISSILGRVPWLRPLFGMKIRAGR